MECMQYENGHKTGSISLRQEVLLTTEDRLIIGGRDILSLLWGGTKSYNVEAAANVVDTLH